MSELKSENIGLKAKVNLLEKEKAELEKRNRELEIKVLEFISFLKEIKVCKGSGQTHVKTLSEKITESVKF